VIYLTYGNAKKGGDEMLDVKKFRSALILKGETYKNIAELLNINVTTLYRKLNGESDFYRSEIDTIAKHLKLTLEEVEEIFFA
jgi:hypothetical protein